MKRRKRVLDDSFDLFLDTITNTFGGVLLIALLIVLMIRETKDSAPEDSHSGPTEEIQVVESQIAALEAEKSSLESALELQQQFEKDFKSEEVKKLAIELAQLTAKNAELQRKFDSLDRKSSLVVSQTKQAETDIQRLNQELASNTAELERLKKELLREQELRTRTMALPKERATSKREVPILVKTDKMYVVNSNRTGYGFTVNTNHFESCSPSSADINFDSQYLCARKGMGVTVNQAEIGREFNLYKNSNCYFAFIVRSDSFDSFTQIRDDCVRSGFEYRILPTDDLVGESSGSNAKIQ